jgi:hypothetical protein
MNWSRGMFRAWFFVSALWLALVGTALVAFWSDVAPRTEAAAAAIEIPMSNGSTLLLPADIPEDAIWGAVEDQMARVWPMPDEPPEGLSGWRAPGRSRG